MHGAQAVADEGDGTTNEGRAIVDRAATALPWFSDEELVAFLGAGEGPWQGANIAVYAPCSPSCWSLR